MTVSRYGPSVPRSVNPDVVTTTQTFSSRQSIKAVGRASLTQKIVQDWAARAARRANVPPGVHILRHTFCSHLAIKGASTRAIQELAGHQDLGTTQRSMHLSPSAIDHAIRLLDQVSG